MDPEQEWLDRKAQVQADIDALLALGLSVETARRLADWDTTLSVGTYAELTDWPPSPAPSFPVGSRDSVKLLVARSTARVNAEQLDEGVIDAGKLYAVFIPDVEDIGIQSITFKLDGVPVHTEASVPWDYAGTTGGGDANRVTFVAGPHIIDADITDQVGIFTISASFEVE